MRKKIKWLLLASALLSGIAFLIVYFYWNAPHRDIVKEAGTKISADSLFLLFSRQEAEANKQYLDKVIRVSGTVSSVNKNEAGKTVLFLQTSDPMFGISCTMENETTDTKAGDLIEVKGLCTGYLSDVVMIRCHLIKEQ